MRGHNGAHGVTRPTCFGSPRPPSLTHYPSAKHKAPGKIRAPGTNDAARARLLSGTWRVVCGRAQTLANRTGHLFNAPVLQQQTLNRPATYSGVGLHSGNRVTMTFLPAPANTGIRFRRLDLEGKPEIEARVENVIVELDANEPPIADGSSREYCRLVQAAGIIAQDERRQPYRVTAPIELEMGDTVMTVFPDEVFKITCTSSDKRGRFTQFYSVELSPKTWEQELAHARTFCFFEEIQYLITNGLIKGGSLENAVVIRDDAVLTNEPLRYADEFVRHKMLDIVGDLALLGRPVHGHLIAVKPSHSANCELVRRIAAQMRKPLLAAQSFAPPAAPGLPPPGATGAQEAASTEGGMDTLRLMQVLPHRYPFLMVDRVIKIEGNHIVAAKSVTVNEPYFQGHFPGQPIMPGVLQLEAIAQVAGIVMLKRAENAGQLAYFMSADKVRWRKPVQPGDVLIIEVELTKMRGNIGKAKGVCKVQGEIVSEAEVTFMLGQG